jgi:hypothetical protein
LTCVKARWARLVADGAPRGLCPRRKAGKLEGIVLPENVGMLKMAEEFGFSVESESPQPAYRRMPMGTYEHSGMTRQA